MKCFFHKTDLDGHCSGAIVYNKYNDCEMIPINYGEEFPFHDIKEDETVYMVDFSLNPFSDMLKLKNMCKEFIWIDHHIAAIRESEKYDEKINGVRMDTYAGCELTWKYLNDPIPIPLAVYLAGRYDIWKHDDHPDILTFQSGMKLEYTWPISEIWNTLLKENAENTIMFKEILDNGRVIDRYDKIMNKRICKNMSYEIEFEGFKFLVLNRSHTNSKIFDDYVDYNKHDAVMLFSRRPECWYVGMYSEKDDIDLSVIASKYGGGGHKTACGFRIHDLNMLSRILP